jgi:chemotaxis protein histidine kinase CheA
MDDFHQHFLTESINNLTILQQNLAENFSENLRREAFRTIHTIKGGAQTFGLENTARLAHELENFLSGGAEFNDQNLLSEGIEVLINSLRQSETNLHAGFIEKLQNANQTAAKSDVLFTKVPFEVFGNLSPQEQSATVSALREGKNIYCAEVGFKAASFAESYRDFRKILSEKSEILASLPSGKYKSAGKIGFRIFLASRETTENLQNSVKDFEAQISSHACTEKSSDNLYKMLAQIAAHTEDVAEKAGKEIRIMILSNDASFSAEQTKSFFDILLHLVRNAVDHAIERSGTIEIRLFDEPDGLYLSVADDGKGIDIEKVRARAVAKNLISDDDLLEQQQIFELIFAPEFSTADTVTEISGRGIGLDAVKAAVEKMNGKISARNRKTKGAIFEIFVPKD